MFADSVDTALAEAARSLEKLMSGGSRSGFAALRVRRIRWPERWIRTAIALFALHGLTTLFYVEILAKRLRRKAGPREGRT
jgi:hypothetical protein